MCYISWATQELFYFGLFRDYQGELPGSTLGNILLKHYFEVFRNYFDQYNMENYFGLFRDHSGDYIKEKLFWSIQKLF